MDVYALGCTLYHLLTGEPPYGGSSASAVMHGHLYGAVPRPSALRPGLPSGFDIVVARALAKKRDDRYSTCRSLSDAARSAQQSAELETPPARPVVVEHPGGHGQRPPADPGTAARTGTSADRTGHRAVWCRRRSVLLAALLVVVAVATAATYVLLPAPRTSAQVVVPFGDLDDPFGVAVDGDGSVYVSDFARNQVVMYEPGTNTSRVLASPDCLVRWASP